MCNLHIYFVDKIYKLLYNKITFIYDGGILCLVCKLLVING